MADRKIVCIGAGSRYFEDVLAELAVTKELAGTKVMLYDINAERMATIMKVGRRILSETEADLSLDSTTDLARALEGANFAISSIGVHGFSLEHHKKDCDVAAKFGIIQTTGDTVGPAGLSQGLRIVPIYLKIARAMEKYCPNVILLQHSNPMAVICRAVRKYTKINVIGYCHNVINDIRDFASCLGIPESELEVVIAGPNHMNWMLGIRHNGKDVYPELIRRMRACKSPRKHIFALETYETLGIFPIGGDRHIIEFFPHARRADKPRNLPYGQTPRSTWINSYLEKGCHTWKWERLKKRAAGKLPVAIPTLDKMSPEAMGNQVRAMAYGKPILQYVNAPNAGAVPNLPDWAVIELKSVIGSHGARPVFVGELPAAAARWSLAQIYAHELTADAAAEFSREKAIAALACDPMIRDFREAVHVFDALVAAHGDWLKPFRKKPGEKRYWPAIPYRVPID